MEIALSDNIPEQLYTARDCREIDNRVITSGHSSGYELMSTAGQCVFDCIRHRFSQIKHILILCGTGNNGGDGYIVAALAAQYGYTVDVVALGPPGTADSNSARVFAEQQGCKIRDCVDKPDLSVQIKAADLIVDALLGTGVDRNVTGYLAQIIGWVNHADIPVLACDIPTGLNSDNGRVMGCCMTAVQTLSFIALKAGLFTASGKAQAGRIEFCDLNVDPKFFDGHQPCAKLITRRTLSALSQLRTESAHKGTTGFAGVIGGAPGMTGAVLMAGKTAYRAGCGRVMVLTHADHSASLALVCPELLTLACHDDAQIAARFNDFSAIALGPGLGQCDWARGLYNQTMQTNVPLVVDADGLNLLSKNKHMRNHWVLTPHPGEAARLLDCSVADIQDDRYGAVNEILSQYGGVCVLKGSGTLIAAENRVIRVCNAGNAGQATAGMGDVLTGCIVGLIAQGYDLFDAACLGTWCHATAADRVAETAGKIGMMATDLLTPIQQLHNELINDKAH